MKDLSDPFAPPDSRSTTLPGDGASPQSGPLPSGLYEPQVRLLGRIDEVLLTSFREQLGNVPDGSDPIVVELTTFGGDADIGRRLALEVRLARERRKRRLVFLGKTVVYSAGVTVMAGFPREDRFLTRDSVLLVHCRQLEMAVQLSGPLRVNAQRLREVLEQIDIGLKVESEGFASLIDGSDVSMEEITERAATNWYVPAEQALTRKLIAGVL